MSEQYLRTDEFQRWAEKFDAKLDRVIEREQDVALATERRLTALETNQANAGKLAARLSGIVAATISALVSAILGYIGGQR